MATNTTTTIRWPAHRKISLRRRKIPTLRLGGDKKPRRGYFVMRVLRKIRLRWLKLHYTCLLRKLKNYYKNLIKDIIEAGATIESYQQRLVMEASMAVPVMGLTYGNYPSMAGSDRPRSVFM